MHIQFKELDKGVEFIQRSVWDLAGDYYLPVSDIVVSVPNWFFYFLERMSKEKLKGFEGERDGGIGNWKIFGAKMQYNHQNHITVFYVGMHTCANPTVPVFEMKINTHD